MSRWKKRSPMTAAMYNEKVLATAGLYFPPTGGMVSAAARQMARAIDKDVMNRPMEADESDFVEDAEEALRKHEGKLRAEKLMAQGYRRVSNKHRHVSRIDRPDWATLLSKDMFNRDVAFYYDNPRQWEDHYRRCYSKDVLVVDQYTSPHVRGSSGEVTGFVGLGEASDYPTKP